MTTASDVDRLRGAYRDLDALALRDLRRFWKALPHDNPAVVAKAVRAFAPELVAAYGYSAALVAADWFDAVRADRAVKGKFMASMAPVAPVAQVQGMVGYAVAPMFAAGALDAHDLAAAQALNRLAGGVSRLVRQPARQTVSRAIATDPARPRYARVTSGATCAFCTMLAGRGPVYWSMDTADDDFHDFCDCVGVAVWDGQPSPVDYSAEKAAYDAAVDVADSRSTADILKKMREQQGHGFSH